MAEQPFLTLHTSGSTGLPKPVDINHGLIASIDAQQLLADVDGHLVSSQEWHGRHVFAGLPPFHSAGINFFAFSVFQGTVLVLGPSDAPPSLGTIERVLDLEVATAGVMAPSLLEEIAADKAVLAKLHRWHCIVFGGGTLSQHAGDALWSQTKVLGLLGSTETFNIPELTAASQDEWSYHRYHPALGIDFQSRHEDMHELVFIRSDEHRKHQGAFWTFPDLSEYPMKDLYEPHPSKCGLWKYKGRLDDTIVLANGEKIFPKVAETTISQNASVKSAMLVGTGYTQAALLVEPAKPPRTQSCLRECHAAVLQDIRNVNTTLPAHAQIHDTHVKVLDSPNAFPRSAKGEIQRALATSELSSEISDVYSSAENQSTDGRHQLDFTDEARLTSSMVSLLASRDYVGRQLPADTNVFHCGFDSLKVMKLLRSIKVDATQAGLGSAEQINARVIYQNPSTAAMSKALLQRLRGGNMPSPSAQEEDMGMQKTLEHYAQKLIGMERPGTPGHTVVLTGSTGSLGSYLLHSLVSNPSVDRVVCLNRGGSDAARQHKINESRGLSTDFASVEFLQVDLTQERFGLDKKEYMDLARRATHIIHNAWPVNFNLTLPSFEGQLQGCCQLLRFASTAPRFADFFFMSSVGVANDWPKKSASEVPEEMISDFDVAESMGYAQSKMLAELLCTRGVEQLGLPVTICRLGQIAGPVLSDHGSWSPNEWFPSMLLSCKALGRVPTELAAMDRMDWLPVDLLADMLVEALVAKDSSQYSDPPSRHDSAQSLPLGRSRYLHFVNPHAALWSNIATNIAPKISEDAKVVPFGEWVDALAAASEDRNMSDLPALKLLDFYEALRQQETKRPVYSTTLTRESCGALRDVPSVGVEWMECWMRQWESAGIASEKSTP